MNKFMHLLFCQSMADSDEVKDEMFEDYLCGLDPFVMTGQGVPNFEKSQPFSPLNNDDWINGNNDWDMF